MRLFFELLMRYQQHRNDLLIWRMKVKAEIELYIYQRKKEIDAKNNQ